MSLINSSTSKSPLISIITVVYNGEKFLEQAIKSVIGQSYKNIEYIIIDGESTDLTTEVIKNYDEFIDKWISEPDEGIYDAMNKGINIASGSVIGILNADDILNNGVLERVAHEFEKNPDIDYIYGYVERITKNGEIYGIADSLTQDEMKVKKYNQIPIPHGALMVKRYLFEELGLYETSYRINSDYDFMLKMIDNEKKGKKIDMAISRYRDGGTSSGYLTFWERKKLLKFHGVPFFRREFIVMKAISKMFLTRVLPKPLLSFLKNL